MESFQKGYLYRHMRFLDVLLDYNSGFHCDSGDICGTFTTNTFVVIAISRWRKVSVKELAMTYLVIPLKRIPLKKEFPLKQHFQKVDVNCNIFKQGTLTEVEGSVRLTSLLS
jgi:hypothetical protein